MGWLSRVIFTLAGDAENTFLDSVIEIHAFLATLFRNFDISQTEIETRVIVPLVLREEYKNMQLPLKVTSM